MKKYRYILFAWLGLIAGTWLIMPAIYADDFVDDIYYIPLQELQQDTLSKELKPVYDKNIREIVFIQDTTQQNDTIVRAIIP